MIGDEASDEQLLFTVFTPTYNRAKDLEGAYRSLAAQTFRDFEWLIVDDGSSDGTAEAVRSWQEVSAFPIRYIFQSNQGKHAAYNRALPEARGRLFLTLDSDDECIPTALERFKFHWESIPEEARGGFSAVTGLCMNADGSIVGDRFPWSPMDSNSLEITYKYGIRGEKWGFQRTDILRQFPFPTMEGYSGYIPESIVWTAIALHYKTRYVNEALRIYHQEASSSLSRPVDVRRRARGRALASAWALDHCLRWLRYSPRHLVKEGAAYSCMSFHAGLGLVQQGRALETMPARAVWGVTLPIGVLAYVWGKARTRWPRLGLALTQFRPG